MRFVRFFACVAAVLLLATGAEAAVKVAKKSISQKTKAYELAITYPVTGNAAIDAVIGKFAKDKLAEYKSDSDDDHQADESAYDFELGYTVERNDDKMFVVLFNESTYTGGAHPNSFAYSFNFLMPDGAQVFLPEIVDGQRGIARISDYAIKDLTRQWADEGADGGDNEWLKRGAGPLASNFDIFVMKPNAIVITFPSYQVTSYAAGPQEVTVPLSALKGLIRKDWRAPQASFDCAKAKSAIEKTICGNAMLARMDRQAGEKYAENLANAYEPTDRDKWRTSQRAWVAVRDKACGGGDAGCLKASYAARMKALQAFTP
jgi:uncharacterized protein YecT (DUF1311 family)